jgi:hypothetical protein
MVTRLKVPRIEFGHTLNILVAKFGFRSKDHLNSRIRTFTKKEKLITLQLILLFPGVIKFDSYKIILKRKAQSQGQVIE